MCIITKPVSPMPVRATTNLAAHGCLDDGVIPGDRALSGRQRIGVVLRLVGAAEVMVAVGVLKILAKPLHLFYKKWGIRPDTYPRHKQDSWLKHGEQHWRD